jgi:endonuclease/exonuclease/phosphatase family metal-dependent hydrolase
MRTVAKEKLADIVTLSPEEMREIMLGIHEALEEIEDIEDVKRIRGEIERGETDVVPLEEVMKELGITDADLQD